MVQPLRNHETKTLENLFLSKWNEINGFVHIWAKLGQENFPRVVSWMRWHWPPDTGFEFRTQAVWGRARYLAVTEVPHKIGSLRVSGEETFCFFEIWRPEWSLNPRSPTLQTGSFNHWTRAPTPLIYRGAIPWRLCFFILGRNKLLEI